jgi:hypothetical protein
MKSSKRLLSALFFLLILECLANAEERSHELSEISYIPSYRNLQLFTPKLKIRLTDPKYTSQSPVVILQDPCTISPSLICIRDPSYNQSQIPQPIKISLSNFSSSSALVYEYSGSYTYPVTLEIYYHTTGTFTQRRYSGLTLTGNFVESKVNTLYLRGYDELNTSTSYLYGYLKGPKDGSVDFSFYHDDIGTIWINQNKIYYNKNWGANTLNYVFVKDVLYYLEILIQNTSGPYGLELKWNLSGSDVIIDDSYMTAPVRLAGMPYLINGLQYNTYCDDLLGFRCVVCDGLCIDCAENSSIKVCTSCKPNSELSAGNCVCKSNFYLSSTNLESCLPCTGLCKDCEEVYGDYICKSCKDNAHLDS